VGTVAPSIIEVMAENMARSVIFGVMPMAKTPAREEAKTVVTLSSLFIFAMILFNFAISCMTGPDGISRSFMGLNQ